MTSNRKILLSTLIGDLLICENPIGDLREFLIQTRKSLTDDTDLGQILIQIGTAIGFDEEVVEK